MGKPFYLSGSVLQHSLDEDVLYGCELADITNGVIQSAGFLLKHYRKSKYVLNAVNTIDKICIEVESTVMPHDFLRLIDEVIFITSSPATFQWLLNLSLSAI